MQSIVIKDATKFQSKLNGVLVSCSSRYLTLKVSEERS